MAQEKIIHKKKRTAWDICSNQTIGIFHLEEFYKRMTWPFIRIVEWPWSGLELQINLPFTPDKTHIFGINYYPSVKRWYKVELFYIKR